MILPSKYWEFMSAFRAFSHFTLDRRWAAGTSKCSAVSYVKGEAAFRTIQDIFRFRVQFGSRSISQLLNGTLKDFLEMFKNFEAKLLKTVNYTSLTLVKCEIKRDVKPK